MQQCLMSKNKASGTSHTRHSREQEFRAYREAVQEQTTRATATREAALRTLARTGIYTPTGKLTPKYK